VLAWECIVGEGKGLMGKVLKRNNAKALVLARDQRLVQEMCEDGVLGYATSEFASARVLE
jgi:hypothetical protein